MKSLTEIRKNRYNFSYTTYPYLNDWRKNPYTWFKAKLYIEASSVLVYLLFKTNINPNTITVIYAVLGIIGGIFLAIPLKLIILLGILVFYFRGILDWADGELAREKKQTSITGDMLDNYGALTGWVCLWTGLSLYIANKSFAGITYVSPNIMYVTSLIFDNDNFVYLIPVIPVIFAMDILLYTNNVIYTRHISREIRNFNQKKNNLKNISIYTKYPKDYNTYPKAKKAMLLVNEIFAHRARLVDFICLIILLELFFPVFFSWIIFLMFLIWQVVYFVGIFYMVARGGYVEKNIQNKLYDIYDKR